MVHLAIVCWLVLASNTATCTGPLPLADALALYHAGARPGTTLPSVFKEGTPEYQIRLQWLWRHDV